jgi:raffinose/stachyose/melibiose transport system permease protein
VVTTTDEARGHPATTRAKRRDPADGDARRPGGLEPSRVGYLYVLPALAVYAAFVLLPLLHTVWLSFFDWNGITVGTWTGLENYAEVLRDEDLRAAFVHSLAFLGFTCALPVALGLVLAALLSRHPIRGLAFFRSVLFLPQVIAMVVVGVAWRWMYADDGAVNQLLRLVGLDGVTRAWLGDFDLALPAVGLVGTWVMYGLCMLLFLSGAQKIDRSLYEAARMDGAGPVREFFAVTLPGLRQEVTVALTITAIYALRNFDLVYVTTNGGPGNSSTVPAVEIYRLAFRESEVGLACAVAVVLMAITFAALLLITRLGRDRT